MQLGERGKCRLQPRGTRLPVKVGLAMLPGGEFPAAAGEFHASRLVRRFDHLGHKAQTGGASSLHPSMDWVNTLRCPCAWPCSQTVDAERTFDAPQQRTTESARIADPVPARCAADLGVLAANFTGDGIHKS